MVGEPAMVVARALEAGNRKLAIYVLSSGWQESGIAGFSVSEASLGPYITIRSVGLVAAAILCAGLTGTD